MIINKIQWQSLNKIGLYLLKQVFTQTTIAFSTVARKDRLRVMVNDEDSKDDDDVVKNIVCKKKNLKVQQVYIFFGYFFKPFENIYNDNEHHYFPANNF